MRYKIFENGAEINTIVSDAAFVESYCAKNGYTYEEDPMLAPKPELEPSSDATVWDELDTAYQEGVNTAYDI